MVNSLFKIFEAGLSIWDDAQSKKYLKAVLDLKEKRQKELDKKNPCNNYVDFLERSLSNLAELASIEIARSKTKDMH